MVALQNDKIAMEFDEHGRLISLSDTEGNVRVPIDPTTPAEAFEIQLRTDAGAVVKVTPTSRPRMKLGRKTLRCDWEISGEWGSLAVTGTITLPPGSPVSEWRLQIENQTGLAVWQLSGNAVAAERADEPVPASGSLKVPAIGHYYGKKAAALIDILKPAWGDERLGVQYGLALNSPQRQFRVGQRVALAVFFRNASDKPLKVDATPDFFWGNIGYCK